MMKQSAPRFLHPVLIKDFFSTYWEQQPLHIHRKNGSEQTYVDLAAIETLLSSQPVYFPGVQLTQSGKVIDVSSYADEQNRILPLRLFDHYAQGATIVLSQAQKLFSPLNELCREVMRTMNMRCQTNVYLSPPGNQGFNAHYDTHDVFIIQVSGEKRFNFYPSSVDLPFPGEGFDSSRVTADEVDESIDLVAGDTLYIPRGVVHDAVAHDAAPSIHITVGVYPILMRDMLQEAIQLVSERDNRFRRSSDSVAATSEDDQRDVIKNSLSSLMNEVQAFLKEPNSVQLVEARFHDELAIGALQNCVGLSHRSIDGHSHDAIVPAFDRVQLRKSMLINYERIADTVKIRTFGQLLEFSDPIGLIVEKLLDSGELALPDLDGLHEAQSEALLKRLLQENLVELHRSKS